MNDKQEKQEAIQKATTSIETIVNECSVLALRDQPVLTQAIRMARGMKALRGILTQSAIELDFMPLQGSPLGFLTDKDQSGGYSWEVVRDVLIEGLLRGFRPIGNEFNIIAGRFYGAKNGFERVVREYPGVSEMRANMGVPTLVGDKGALVPCEARWRFQGKEMDLVCSPAKDGDFDNRIPVKVNSGMVPDAILGKATRKLYARVYQRLTGCSSDVVDGETNEIMPAESLPAPAEAARDGQRIRLNGKRNSPVEVAGMDAVTGEMPPITDAEKLRREVAEQDAADRKAEAREPGSDG